ncbi:MAG: DMT family transporter [Eubacteriales bacterium]|nr:DMT family transporter [Eubacteriales bacterium]
MRQSQMRNSLILLLTATIWGVAFVAQSVGMDYVGPFTFNCVRSLIGGLVLLPCMAVLDKINPPQKKADETEAEKRAQRKILFTGGICCGLALCAASSFQQIGIMYTTVGKAGFITAFYIIIVPVLGLLFGRKCGINVWIGVVLALAGLYFLCITESLSVGKGDILVFICAIIFSIHIMVIDHFSPLADGVKLSCIQFFVSGIICAVPMLLIEKPQIAQLLQAWQPILYAGVMSCGVAYTLQIVGQKGMNPTVASLILSLESVISVIAGAIILHQILSARELLGCVLMFAAILLAQLPQPRKKSGVQ